jgi:hypothetical protein
MITDKGDNWFFGNACLFCVLKLNDDKNLPQFYKMQFLSLQYSVKGCVWDK